MLSITTQRNVVVVIVIVISVDERLDPIALSRAAAERRSSDHHRPLGGHLSILDRKLTGFSDPGSPFSDSRLLHPVRSR